MLIDPELWKKWREQMSEKIPPELKAWQSSMHDWFRESLEKCFNSMDLVTREDYELQQKQMVALHQKLDSLQQQLDKLIQQKAEPTVAPVKSRKTKPAAAVDIEPPTITDLPK